MTILYAEDDSMTVMEVQEKLENNGYEVIVAYDGNEALEKFIACKPDLIVLDVDMPGKDGLEVLQFIRLQDSQTPVIIYSCLIDEEKQIKGLEWGANVYLLKNYSPTLLLAQIQRCIARSGEEVIRLSKQVEYDFSACNLRVSDVVYHLTMLENKIFSILCKNESCTFILYGYFIYRSLFFNKHSEVRGTISPLSPDGGVGLQEIRSPGNSRKSRVLFICLILFICNLVVHLIRSKTEISHVGRRTS